MALGIPKERFMRLVLIGPPAVGKGTCATQLARRLQIPHISVGDLLRARALTDPLLASIISSGQLVDEGLTFSLIEERVSHSDCADGFMLDGFPRSKGQALWLTHSELYPNLVLHFDAPRPVLIERFRKRAVGSGRSDDVLEVYVERLKLHDIEGQEVIEHFRELGVLRTLCALPAVELIVEDVLELLEKEQVLLLR